MDWNLPYNPGDSGLILGQETKVPHAVSLLAPEPTLQPRPNAAAAAKSLQLCPTLCDPIEGSPPGPPVPGILQARTLQWVTISFSDA